MSKTNEILKLEKAYKIRLKELPKNGNLMSFEYRNNYEVDTKGKILGINLIFNNIDSIEILSDLKNLKNLNLAFNQISDIKNLDHLKSLISLDLSSNQITEIKNLNELTNLTDLDLSSNQILEIKNLNTLKNLTNLDLSRNKIDSIKNLNYLKNLINLDLSSNQITEIKNLNELTNLIELYLHSNEINEIKNLNVLKNLTKLYLSSNQITEIKNLDELKNLIELYLSSNQITEIKNLDELKNLTKLYLSSNQITEIKNLDELNNLANLSLSSNQISEIKDLDDLENLTNLDLSSNQIIEIKNLNELPNFTNLNLSSNQISEIKNLSELKDLTILDLSSNQISEIKNLDELKDLTILDLSSNQISEIKNLNELKDLTVLDLSENKITEIENLNELQSLLNLSLSSNQISEIENLDELQNLTNLSLFSNQILQIKSLDKLKKLTDLYLSSNQISEIKNLDELNNLVNLNLSSNQISEIKNLNKLKNIINLNLSSNQISEIKNLDKLKNIINLNLSSNQIVEIENLNELKKVKNVNLSSNKINSAKPILFFIKKNFKILIDEKDNYYHNIINLYNNPLQNPPEKIIKEGNSEILKYFEEIEKYGYEKLYEGKLLIVGEPKHGKTSLRKKLFNINYQIPEKTEIKETVGVEIQNNYIISDNENNQQKLLINIWDFGGQEKQYPLHQYFLKKNSVFVLVSDDRKDNTNLDNWMYKLKLFNGNDKEIILFFNQINRNSKSTNFDAEKYKKLGFSFREFFLDISQDKERFLELKNYIDKSICNLPHIGKDYPKYCKSIAENIDEKRFKENKNYLTIQEFEKLCIDLGYSEVSVVKNALNYLDIIGKVIYYEDDENLNHLIILNPHWLIDAIYGIITCKDIEEKNGRFNRDWYEKYMAEISETKSISYSKSEFDNILRLMLKNQLDICYTVNDQEFVVPLLMPNKLPENNIDFSKDTLSILFKYEVMPSGLIARLLVRLSDYIKDNLLSNSSGIINKDNSVAKIEEYFMKNDANKYIKISVVGENKVLVLNEIRNELIDIQKDWFENIKIQELIPCNCSKCKDNDEDHKFLKSDLINRTKNNRFTVECPESYNPINIFELLDVIYGKHIINSYTQEEIEKIKNNIPTTIFNIGDYAQILNSQFGGKYNKQDN